MHRNVKVLRMVEFYKLAQGQRFAIGKVLLFEMQ